VSGDDPAGRDERIRPGRGSAEAVDLPAILDRLAEPRSGTDDPEVAALFRADQGDRTAAPIPPDIMERDAARRARVLALLAAGRVRTPRDFFHAAIVFQHGSLLDHYRLAFELARRAADAGAPGARWLAAAATDRLLMFSDRPQRFGTQYVQRDGRWVLYQVDPATTDEVRAEWGVPPLAEARRRADDLNRQGLHDRGGEGGEGGDGSRDEVGE